MFIRNAYRGINFQFPDQQQVCRDKAHGKKRHSLEVIQPLIRPAMLGLFIIFDLNVFTCPERAMSLKGNVYKSPALLWYSHRNRFWEGFVGLFSYLLHNGKESRMASPYLLFFLIGILGVF